MDVRRLSAPLEILLVVAAFLTYFGVRALTQGSRGAALAHAEDVVALEQRAGIDWEGDVQSVVAAHRPLLDLANWVYIWGHWPVIAVTAVWLFRRRPEIYRRLRNAMFASGAIGMAIFAAFPVAPPRLAGLGLVDTVTAYSHSYRALQPPALTNIYAAMPSLHFGWDLLVGLTLATEARRLAVRLAGVAMPVLMGLAVVVTANHYVVDVVAGGVVAITGLAVASALDRRGREPSRRARDPRPAWSVGRSVLHR